MQEPTNPIDQMPQSIEKKVCNKSTALPATLKPVLATSPVFDSKNEKKT